MSESERTAQDREVARREREARRAAREGRPTRFEQAAEEFASDPPVFDDEAAPMPTPDDPSLLHEPEPEPDPESDPESEPEPEPEPEPDPESELEPESEPPATEAHVPIEEPPLVTERGSGRPIKSVPSAPDPAFYASDDELETEVPSGTRRVSRRSGSRTAGSGRPPRRPRGSVGRVQAGSSRRRHWRVRIVALFFLVLAAAIIYFAISIFQPFGTSPHGRVTIHVRPDSSASQVGTQLAKRGVISSSFFFELRATLDGDRSNIRAGTFHLRKGMSYGSVLSTLTAVPKAAKTSELTLDEGHTRQYVAVLLKKQHVKGDYLAATRHSKLLDPRSYGAPKSTRTLEGFLFPDTYQLVDPPRVTALVADQLTDFKKRFATVGLGWARAHRYSGFDVLTVASLIQAEAASAPDMPKVASVIYNRLRDHMMLQLDSTARYASGNFTKPLTVSELNSRAPYNTHTHFGLPPGPIDSPGLTAIRAAAHPATTHYLYFFSKPCTDRTVFATSYGEFENLLVRDKREHCPAGKTSK